MSDIVLHVQERLVYDRGSPEAEWEVVEELLSQFPVERNLIIRWLLEKHNGYIDTRSRAGLEFIRHDPTTGWRILSILVSSANPDDRDTGLAVLESLDNSGAAEMALPLLNDEWPYIRLEAAKFLYQFYPSEAVRCLEYLVQEGTPSVREEARKLLAEMEKISTTSSATTWVPPT